jgi:thioredoxin
MLKTVRSLLSVIAVISVLSVVIGCEKLRNMAGKPEGGAETTAEAATVTGAADPAQISNLGQADYASFISRRNALVIIDFHAEWCGPCRILGPVLEKAVAAHPGVVYLGKVDVDQAPSLAQAQNVTGLPDVRFFKDGREVDRFVGFPGERAVLDRVAELAKGITPAAPATPAAQSPAEPPIQPFKKDWMPEGMKRKGEGTP